jgi:hypothetical protein
MAVTQQLNGGETRILEIREWITESRKSVIQNTDPGWDGGQTKR